MRVEQISLFGLGFGLFLVLPIHAAENRWTAGLILQGSVDFEPGNDYLYGPQAGYSNDQMFHHKLELDFAYLTSRPETAFRNVLKQDWFILSPTWRFRPQRFFDPIAQLNLGYQRYDLESNIFTGYLNNHTWVYGAKAGFDLSFGKARRYSLNYRLGFQQSSEQSSYVYPLPFSLAFSVAFPREER